MSERDKVKEYLKKYITSLATVVASIEDYDRLSDELFDQLVLLQVNRLELTEGITVSAKQVKVALAALGPEGDVYKKKILELLTKVKPKKF